ncbi:MAG: GTPase domain-containing protein [Planctomycetia bacterium]|nr:GTPase domain-containing protein [Planctomycetia bacterium]
MSFDFTLWSVGIRGLCDALAALRPQAEELGVASPEREEWHQLLLHKLRPQSFGTPPLVVAVVGGTNIGKSAIFNQLAGEDASSVSPLAAGTKHPVCLCPAGTTDDGLLRSLFEEFTLKPWSAAADALASAEEHFLFWRASAAVPQKLLLLDTPDIDSDAQVNWQRADAVRQTADVLIAVLTQQKYNDAAVKKFFTRAAEADKAVIIVFNQIDLALDRDIWPTWAEVFCRDTGVKPVRIYAVPYDRRGSQTRGLTFYDIGDEGRSQLPAPTDLGRELADLRYDELKARTLRGALKRVVDPRIGVERYLAEVRETSRRFAAAREALADAHRVTTAWPGLPASVLVGEIQHWWDARRGEWSRTIHGFYRKIGSAVTAPVKRLWRGPSDAAGDPLAEYRRREQAVIIEGVSRLLDELERLANVGNEILRPRVTKLLGGTAREEYLRRINAAYAQLPAVDDEFRNWVGQELEKFERDHPRAASWLRSFDTAAAFARPAITVSLALTGVWLPAGDVLGQTFVHVAGQTAGEIATTVVVAGSGEAMVGAAGTGLKHAAGQLFRRLQSDHARRRALALTAIFERELLGELLAELQRGASVGNGAEWRAAAEAATTLRALAS